MINSFAPSIENPDEVVTNPHAPAIENDLPMTTLGKSSGEEYTQQPRIEKTGLQDAIADAAETLLQSMKKKPTATTGPAKEDIQKIIEALKQ